MKKTAAVALIVLLCTMMFTACGESGGSSGGAFRCAEATDLGWWDTAATADIGCCDSFVVGDTALIGVNSVTRISNDFIMTLNSDRHVYSTEDVITIWGTIEYTGDGDTVEIWHGCPIMSFHISGGGYGFTVDDHLGGVVLQIQMSSTLERGRVYHFMYRKSGLFTPGEPFWEDFFAQEDFRLPAGEYRINLRGEFSLPDGTRSGLRAGLNIRVVQ